MNPGKRITYVFVIAPSSAPKYALVTMLYVFWKGNKHYHSISIDAFKRRCTWQPAVLTQYTATSV